MLDGKGSGMIQERVRFGEQRLVMTALHNAELGRWVVIVARSNSIWMRGLWYLGIILGMSLILWILVATLVGATLKQKISGPLRKLDDRTIELVRGHSVSEAALDRLWAETAPALGGHADCVVDLARRLQSRELLLAETDLRFRSVFDAMPAMALIRDSDSVIVDCNRELAERLDADMQWITGRNVSLMTGILPVAMLEKWFSHADSPKVGVSRMEVFPSEVDEISEPLAISIYPLRHRGKSAHVIIAEKLLDITDLNHPSSQTDPDLEHGLESDQGHSGDSSSVDVDIDAADAGASSSSDDLLSGVLKATRQFVVVFDENAETIFWSPAARLITGVDTLSVGDMKWFTQKIFPNREERRLFKSWIDGAPEKRSQELNIRTMAGTVSSRWYACEIDLQGRGSVGVLWATLDVSVTHKSPSIGEPVA
jgi:PAS domain-containing protein